MAGMDSKSGDKVKMVMGNEVVAFGAVCVFDPDGYCSGVKIGVDNVSVIVEKCINSDTLFPFPTMDATKIGETI